MISVIGGSGSGKTTMLKLINGLLLPDQGHVYIDGVDIQTINQNELRRHIGYVIQNIGLFPHMNIEDNISYVLRLQKTDPQMIKERVHELIVMMDLDQDILKRYPDELSGGQKQRIGIARALIMNPDLIIADEAISALDVSIQAQVVNLMKKIQKETGIAYLFIAHDLSMVKYISDKIGVLHLGHLVETGTTEEIFDNPIHPYTKSLLSAIPHPNPRVEKVRKSFTYDYKESGVDYTKGTEHLVDGTHYVLATDEEFEKWTKK